MKNRIEDLRNHLFAQLEKLSDDDCDLEKESKRANAIVEVAAAIIESGRVEVEYLKATSNNQNDSTGFFPKEKEEKRKYFLQNNEPDVPANPTERPKPEYSNKSFTHGQIYNGDEI